MAHPLALYQQTLNMLESLGALGPLVFIPISAFGAMVFVPNTLLGLTAGALFGLPVGFVLVSISAAVSAAGGFLAGRSWSRNWVLKKIALSKRTEALDDAVTREGWRMVALLRQTAILPFSLVNYMLGLSKITFKDYILASWIGMMPGQILCVYLGAITKEIALEGHQRQRTVAEWIFFAMGLVLTIGISVRATFIVKKALQT